MFKNFITEVLHATRKVKSPEGEFEKLGVGDAEFDNLQVKGTATVKKKLVAEDNATIKNLEVTTQTELKGKTKIADVTIEAINQLSGAFGKDTEIKALNTDADEWGTHQKNENSNDSGEKGNAKFARVGHTHKIPNAIKNPKSLTIQASESSTAEGKLKKTYDGSAGLDLDITPAYVGAAPKSHTSKTKEVYGGGTDSAYGHVKLHELDVDRLFGNGLVTKSVTEKHDWDTGPIGCYYGSMLEVEDCSKFGINNILSDQRRHGYNYIGHTTIDCLHQRTLENEPWEVTVCLTNIMRANLEMIEEGPNAGGYRVIECYDVLETDAVEITSFNDEYSITKLGEYTLTVRLNEDCSVHWEVYPIGCDIIAGTRRTCIHVVDTYMDTVLIEDGDAYVKELKKMDADAAVALTPSSLQKYASFANDHYLAKPVAGKPLSISRMLVDRIEFGDDAYISKAGIDGQANGKLLIGSLTSAEITQIQLGSKNPTVLTANGDGHLYISGTNYNSKISDFEIERIITSNSEPDSKKWVPSREGYYRIFMIGGGGYGSGAFATKLGSTDTDKGNLNKNGYGFGNVYPGFGGCGAPVVVVNMKTSNAQAVESSGTIYRVVDGYLDDGVDNAELDVEGVLTINSISLNKTDAGNPLYKITISLYNINSKYIITGWRQLGADEDGRPDDEEPLFEHAAIVDGKASFTIEEYELPSWITVDDSDSSNITYSINKSKKEALEFTDINVSAITCKLKNATTTFADDYMLRNMTFSFNITLAEDSSGGGDSSGSSSGDVSSTDDDTSNTATETGGEETLDDTLDLSTEVGVTFTFFKSPRYRISNSLARSNGFSQVRCVGANGFSTVGIILDEQSGSITPTNNKQDNAPTKPGGTYGTTKCTATGANSNDPNTKGTFEVFVGHGYDTWTVSNPSSTIYTSSGYGRKPSVDTLNPNGVYIYGDPFANLMIGGSEHYSGVNGWLNQSKSSVNEDDYTWMEGSAKRRSCQNGYCGGPPGSIGVTGYNGTNKTSPYGIETGKGSVGGILSKAAYKSTYSGAKTTVSCQGGHGASFSIASLDGYNGSIMHSDTSAKSKQLRFPGYKSTKGGYGYYGGGVGGGGGVVYKNNKDTAKCTSTISIQSEQTKNANLVEPIVIIAYLGQVTEK